MSYLNEIWKFTKQREQVCHKEFNEKTISKYDTKIWKESIQIREVSDVIKKNIKKLKCLKEKFRIDGKSRGKFIRKK